MVVVPHSHNYDPGTWKRLQTKAGGLAVFTCPQGHPCTLSDYEILPDGSVHPAVMCATCKYWAFLRLEEWRTSPLPLPRVNLDKLGR